MLSEFPSCRIPPSEDMCEIDHLICVWHAPSRAVREAYYRPSLYAKYSLVSNYMSFAYKRV